MVSFNQNNTNSNNESLVSRDMLLKSIMIVNALGNINNGGRAHIFSSAVKQNNNDDRKQTCTIQLCWTQDVDFGYHLHCIYGTTTWNN